MSDISQFTLLNISMEQLNLGKGCTKMITLLNMSIYHKGISNVSLSARRLSMVTLLKNTLIVSIVYYHLYEGIPDVSMSEVA